MKYILFVGDDIKMGQAIGKKINLCCRGRNQFGTQAWEKGAQ